MSVPAMLDATEVPCEGMGRIFGDTLCKPGSTMHRLPRQALRLRSVARLGRVQRPLLTHSTPSLLLRRHYASQKTPAQKFDLILASLRPGMKTDEFARKMAALLVLSEHDEEMAQRMFATVQPLVDAKGVQRELLSKKVDFYMAEPPEDNYDAFVDSLDAPENDERYTQFPTDPSLEHPGSTLEKHLQNELVQNRLRQIHILRRADLTQPLERLEEDPNDMEAYIEIAKLLEEFGVPITYERRTIPADVLAEDSTELMGEMRESISEIMEDITVEDPQVAAKMATEDAEYAARAERAEQLQQVPSWRTSEMLGGEKSKAGVKAKVKQEEHIRADSLVYPNLMVSDPLLDSRDVLELPPDGKDQIFHNRVIIRNNTSIFHEAMEDQGFDFDDPEYMPTRTDETEESASSLENLPLSPSELADYYRFPLVRRRVTQQTGKGKIHRMYVLMVVGNGNGMVGLGQGKDDDATRAEAKAYAQAVRNMDWVERFENRTIWTDMETKLGSTQLLLRPRPVGFGLRCNPNLHQVLKAAGIKDISAKVWGSRNPINVIKAAFRVLQAGHEPLGMGDGIGGRGRKLNKGSGLRSKEDVERERGRQLISLRKS
ncbi:hypothetical protein C0995_012613 [Termitomyces sp. Mi166|nr:hypothetical protein C0995_012613 [Termitomyces sp. Mi166\